MSRAPLPVDRASPSSRFDGNGARGRRAHRAAGWVLLALALLACPSAPPPAADVTKEDLLATREGFLARREAEMAQREALVAVREQALAIREEAIFRRETMAGLPASEREQLRREAQSTRERIVVMLASQGLELRDAPESLRGHLERGDNLLAGRDFTAAKLAYASAEAFAAGTVLDEKLLRRRLDEASATLQSSTLAPAEKSRLSQLLLQARGRMADRAYKDCLALIKRVEDAAAPPDAKKP